MTENCTCFVSLLSAEDQFQIRWGAHALHCPVYRPSGDPVDRRHDEDFRDLWNELQDPELLSQAKDTRS